MQEFYNLPDFGNLIIFKSFYIFEIYLLLIVWLFLYLFLNKYNIKKILFIFVWVFLYKFLTLSIFWNSSCSCINSYYPSLWFINILIWILTVAEVWLWFYLSNLLIEKYKKEKEKPKFINKKNIFFFTILFAYIFSIIDEIIIRFLDLRIYSDELNSLLSGYSFLTIPLESYIYMLVWTILIVWVFDFLNKFFWDNDKKNNIISFFKIFNKKDKENKPNWFFRYFYISLIWMFLIEILVHPIFINSGLPRFTYIYQDLNWLLTIIWSLWFSWVIYGLDYLFRNNELSITKTQYLSFNLFILFILNILIFNLLFSFWIISLSEMASSYLWWFNVLWLPFEVFSWVFITNILVFMFVKSRLIK